MIVHADTIAFASKELAFMQVHLADFKVASLGYDFEKLRFIVVFSQLERFACRDAFECAQELATNVYGGWKKKTILSTPKMTESLRRLEARYD